MNTHKTPCRALGGCLLLALVWLLPPDGQAQAARAWSLEEVPAPLTASAFSAGQAEGGWVEVDEARFRALREGVVALALEQLALPPGASALEALLRDRLLYYTPELETYWPPYAEAGTLRIKRWPVRGRVEREAPARLVLSFQLGRPQDDARRLRLAYEGDWLASVSLTRQRYAADDLTAPRTQTRTLVLLDGVPATATLFEELDGIWQPTRLGFEAGALAPGFGRLDELDDPAAHGVALLLAYDRHAGTPLDRLVFDPREVPLAFQVVRGLVAQTQAQLGGADPELERALRQQLLEFSPWGFLNQADADHLYTTAYELVSLRRLEAEAGQARYRLTLGNLQRRTVTVTLAPEGPHQARLVALELDLPFRHQGAVWHERRAFRFSPGGGAALERWVVDAEGAVVTPVADRLLATFGLAQDVL